MDVLKPATISNYVCIGDYHGFLNNALQGFEDNTEGKFFVDVEQLPSILLSAIKVPSDKTP